jgi:signal peptidase I
MPQPSFKSEIWEEVLSWSKTVAFAVAFALLVNNFVIVNASVPTGSMKETIMERDRIVAFRLSYRVAAFTWSYWFSEPKRYDIVVFRYPDDESTLFIKRIIGLPGDVIEIKAGKVYLNGSDTPLRDDFTSGEYYGNAGPFHVPDGHYFMLGDNRGNSRDSRDWRNTYLEKEKILGKAIFKYFPGFKNLYGV